MISAPAPAQTTVPMNRDAEFAAANQSDDAELRRLLRENPLGGSISLSLEREPDFFADAGLPDEEKVTIVARTRGRIRCCGSCVTRQRFVNGRPCRVGYLGGLRLDADCAGRFDIVRRGYAVFGELQRRNSPDFFFTSISADNDQARRFLERGLPGMPRYEFVGEYVTILVSSRRLAVVRPSGWELWPEERLTPASASELATLLNDGRRHGQFAPVWSPETLRALEPLGLRAGDFLVKRMAGRLAACAALWDQRPYKQAVIRGYSTPLRYGRSAINLFARLTGRPLLPAVGTALAHAVVACVGQDPGDAESLASCVEFLRGRAAERRIDFLSLGLATDDARLKSVRRRFNAREYRSRLYVVRWPDMGGSVADLDGRPAQPELALL